MGSVKLKTEPDAAVIAQRPLPEVPVAIPSTYTMSPVVKPCATAVVTTIGVALVLEVI
jgi:hypothetical protein